MSHPLNFENLPFSRAKTVVQCTSAEQLTGPRAIGALLLLKKRLKQKLFAGQPLTPPKFIEVTSLCLALFKYWIAAEAH